MVQLMPLPSRRLLLHLNPEWFLPFWCQLTLVGLEKEAIKWVFVFCCIG